MPCVGISKMSYVIPVWTGWGLVLEGGEGGKIAGKAFIVTQGVEGVPFHRQSSPHLPKQGGAGREHLAQFRGYGLFRWEEKGRGGEENSSVTLKHALEELPFSRRRVRWR